MNICVCGGGNIAHVLVGLTHNKPDINISLLTRSPEKWADTVHVSFENENRAYTGHLNKVSNDPKDVIPNADIILVTVPSFARQTLLDDIRPYITKGTWIGAIPGIGGFYWRAMKTLENTGANVFSMRKSLYMCRIKEPGKSANVWWRRPNLHLYGSEDTEELIKTLGYFFEVPVEKLTSIFEIELNFSNPILHTARLFREFYDYKKGKTWVAPSDFYSDWDEMTTEYYVAMDNEVKNIIDVLPYPFPTRETVMEYYSTLYSKPISSIADLAHAIRKHTAGVGSLVPMIKSEKGYIPDISSRYFLEDFPHGLVLIKGIAAIAEVESPTIDMIISWGQKMLAKEYIVNGKLIGKDLHETSIPQNFGIHTLI